MTSRDQATFVFNKSENKKLIQSFVEKQREKSDIAQLKQKIFLVNK